MRHQHQNMAEIYIESQKQVTETLQTALYGTNVADLASQSISPVH